MGSERLILGMIIVGVFALVFSFFAWRMPPEERRRWFPVQASGALIPFAFALYFAANSNLGEHLYPLGILLVLLCVAAALVSRFGEAPGLLTGAASAALAVLS